MYDCKLTHSRFVNSAFQMGILNPGSRLLVALSGGQDSVALLHLLIISRDRFRIDIQACHINHHLRKSANSDQVFVEVLCKNWGVDLKIFHANPETRKNGESVEMWARSQRYKYFNSAKENMNCRWVLTGHHGNDQVETILMHLDQGCGIEGLRGIPLMRDPFVRPLLPFSKLDIKSYVFQNKLDFREDDTNNDLSIRRNFIRHNLVKKWEVSAPKLVDRFRSISEKAREASASMDIAIKLLQEKIVSQDSGKFIIDNHKMGILSSVIFARLVKLLCGDKDIPWRKFQWINLMQFYEQATTGKTYKLKEKWVLLKNRHKWYLEQSTLTFTNLNVSREKTYSINSHNKQFSWRKINSATLDVSNPWVEVIDEQKIRGKKLYLRNWSKGDRFHPLGLEGSKKVSDFLTDLKMDLFTKQEQLVLTAEDEIIWLCGLRLSETFKISNSTHNFVELSFQNNVGLP